MNSRIPAQAYWLTSSRLAWNPSKLAQHDQTSRFWINGGGARIEAGAVRPGRYRIPLDPDGPVSKVEALAGQYPYLANHQTLVNVGLEKVAAELLTEDLLFTVERPNGEVLYSTGVQNFGVIDDVAAYDGDDLGVWIDVEQRPVFKLWAPTAKSVKLHIYEKSHEKRPRQTMELKRGEKGVWAHTGVKSWIGQFYLYEVEVFVYETNSFQRNLVTDPYSFSLGMNSRKSQIIDVTAAAHKPEGWDKLKKRGPAHPVDMSIYELHVRDFSSQDLTVSSELRGKYLAFTDRNSLGLAHLRKLADAGLTHVHLLPVADFASVNDDEDERLEPEIPIGMPPDSQVPQAVIAKAKDKGVYNWGYDPLHYFVPEGSYSTKPDGAERIQEFRSMVMGLHGVGLRVIMDVVFNHTYHGGQSEKSVLDRVVPNYYYRLNGDGFIETSACGGCPDTATEHEMMGKLMRDAIVFWAKQYKIDGFRFDLMSFHTKESVLAVRKALDRLTLEKDGVDGKRIYLYGEGWTFGSLHGVMPDRACVQWNMFGTGIGTFNDRMRDKIRGGNFSHDTRTEQAFATGLYWDDNGLQGIKPEDQKNRLLQFTDVIRVGMAGNLRAFKMKSWLEKETFGDKVDAGHGTPTGYAAAPEETVNYVSAHDNYELWDQIAAKAPFGKHGREPATAGGEERARMQRIALSLVALSQGVPFFTAGSDFLRSKSGDGDSYASGDWFNGIDWGMHSNNWGVGLPNAEKNGGQWEFWAPRLREQQLRPSPDLMQDTAEHFKACLRVRMSSKLFRLQTAEQIYERVSFLETDYGMGQPPGFICMLLRDDVGKEKLDPERKAIVAAWNATRQPVQFTHDALKGRALTIHRDWGDWHESFEPRLQEAAFHSVSGQLVIPPQTLIVFEERIR